MNHDLPPKTLLEAEEHEGFTISHYFLECPYCGQNPVPKLELLEAKIRNTGKMAEERCLCGRVFFYQKQVTWAIWKKDGEGQRL